MDVFSSAGKRNSRHSHNHTPQHENIQPFPSENWSWKESAFPTLVLLNWTEIAQEMGVILGKYKVMITMIWGFTIVCFLSTSPALLHTHPPHEHCHQNQTKSGVQTQLKLHNISSRLRMPHGLVTTLLTQRLILNVYGKWSKCAIAHLITEDPLLRGWPVLFLPRSSLIRGHIQSVAPPSLRTPLLALLVAVAGSFHGLLSGLSLGL